MTPIIFQPPPPSDWGNFGHETVRVKKKWQISGVPDICSNIRLKYKYEKFEILFCVQNLIFSIQPSGAQSCQQDFLQSNQSPKKRVSGLTISIFFFFFMFFVWFFDIFHLSLEHNQSWKKRLSWKRTSRCRIRLTTDAATSIY